MELSKIEIKGFKSFGDKVIINFDADITGIVGPNGCGKSNVVDALRWVLGEQKQKNLRSDKMENVIFNGTKNRKPSQMAEVSLTLNNTKNLLPTEYSQITITRKYYRSGESEYMLNGVQCRLKDIQTLFMDTGIGPDSYAIIELKMVDDILNDKNDSRRTLFEEAAGISKFKTRKKQTIKKLEDTDLDLARVEDLLFEIEKNMKSLEKQAKQAETYFVLKDEYKKVSIDLAKLKTKNQAESLKRIQANIETAQDEKLLIGSKIKELDAQIEKEKTQLIVREKALSARQKAINEHVETIRKIEGEKKIKNERLRFLTDKKNALTTAIEQDRVEKLKSEADIEALQLDIKKAEDLLNEKKQIVEQLKTSLENQKQINSEKEAKLTELGNTFNVLKEKYFQSSKDIEIKELQRNSIKSELEKQDNDNSEHKHTLDEFDNQLQSIEKDYNSKKSILDKLNEQQQKNDAEFESNQIKIDELKDEVTKLNRKLDAKENEYELTKSLVENLEGFPEAIKFLKKNDRWNKDTPLLSDVITTSDEYRTCIENYLETYLNYYIVDEEHQAIQAINILSDSSKGRANFFVLKNVQKIEDFPIVTFENAVPAIDIVDVDEKYIPLFKYLLNKVFIVKGENDEFPKSVNGEVFLSKNGKIIKRKLSLSGGSVGLFEGKKIGRKKNLDILKEDIKKISAEITKKKSQLDKLISSSDKIKENSKKLEIEKLSEDFKKINNEYITLKTKKEQFENLIKFNSGKREEMTEKMNVLEKEIQEIKPFIINLEVEKNEAEKQLNSIRDEIAGLREMLSEKSTAFNNENIVFHQTESKLNTLLQNLNFKNQNQKSAQERLEINSRELKAAEEEIKKIIDNQEGSDSDLIKLYEEKESLEKGLLEAEKEYYESRGLIQEVEKNIRQNQTLNEQKTNLIQEYQTALNDLKIGLSGIKERLSVEFDINLDQIIDEEIEINSTLEELELKAVKSKEKIDRLGVVNPMAKEAYDEIKARYTFINEQKQDLIKAKETLLATIKEIDQVAKENFVSCFTQVRENFIKVFRSLFTEEDSCDLRLMNPDDPLESEIQIIAKPKGKRPLTINQLSGGEKTLTAVALLFSIYLLKPAPFCVFDEVDAPLDDANIDKFNNIIRTFSKDSQFIIVTHNKRTMASTDVIYGVTMIEQGVSRVVPVDLRSLA